MYDEYRKLAKKKKIHFIAASEYVKPSETDQEHMNEEGHALLSEAIFQALSDHDFWE